MRSTRILPLAALAAFLAPACSVESSSAAETAAPAGETEAGLPAEPETAESEAPESGMQAPPAEKSLLDAAKEYAGGITEGAGAELRPILEQWNAVLEKSLTELKSVTDSTSAEEAKGQLASYWAKLGELNESAQELSAAEIGAALASTDLGKQSLALFQQIGAEYQRIAKQDPEAKSVLADTMQELPVFGADE